MGADSMAIATSKKPRPLTHDEAKAAEAAFQGQPFNLDWSQSARTIYDGISAAVRRRRHALDAFPLLEYQSAQNWDGSLDECVMSREED